MFSAGAQNSALNRLWQSERSKVFFRKEIIFAGFVDDPDQPESLARSVR